MITVAGKWKKVGMNPTWVFWEDKEIVGTYVLMEENVGPNRSTLYSLKKDDGSLIGVWGNTLLDSRFKNIQIGDEVRIVYLGKDTSEKTGREFNNYDVYSRSVNSIGETKNEGSKQAPI